MDCLMNCSLSQLVTFPTRNDNTLDIFATNRPSSVEKCEPLSGISDHNIVHVVTKNTEESPLSFCLYPLKKPSTILLLLLVGI